MESDQCPTCGSPEPHLHPSEVEVCRDEFHKQVTAINTEAKINAL